MLLSSHAYKITAKTGDLGGGNQTLHGACTAKDLFSARLLLEMTSGEAPLQIIALAEWGHGRISGPSGIPDMWSITS